MTESFSIGAGDRLVLMCSVVFSVHILVIDYFSPKADGVVISCVQFFTAGVIAGVLMLLFDIRLCRLLLRQQRRSCTRA